MLDQFKSSVILRREEFLSRTGATVYDVGDSQVAAENVDNTLSEILGYVLKIPTNGTKLPWLGISKTLDLLKEVVAAEDRLIATLSGTENRTANGLSDQSMGEQTDK